jgi:hypothetical protein
MDELGSVIGVGSLANNRGKRVVFERKLALCWRW